MFTRFRHLLKRPRPGFTLVEVIIAMAMVAVIAGAITFTILAKIAEAKIQRGVDEVATLEKGVASWVYRTGSSAYTNLKLSDPNSTTDMVDVSAVPAALAGATANPWGGSYDVQGTGANSFQITATNVPANAVGAFQGAFGSRATVTHNPATNNTLTLAFSE
jgi:prepilin-type N-terminal cleavage/methylation domain-containing protein